MELCLGKVPVLDGNVKSFLRGRKIILPTKKGQQFTKNFRYVAKVLHLGKVNLTENVQTIRTHVYIWRPINSGGIVMRAGSRRK